MATCRQISLTAIEASLLLIVARLAFRKWIFDVGTKV